MSSDRSITEEKRSPLCSFWIRAIAPLIPIYKYRKKVLQQVAENQSTAELVIILAAFGTISLTLLLFACLNSDLFAPLKEIKQSLDRKVTYKYKLENSSKSFALCPFFLANIEYF
ncbi:MAG: hypothetical protein ACFCAD_14315 [Pleurocapsa sp.]